jgi:serine/threonine-protein kinase HipA
MDANPTSIIVSYRRRTEVIPVGKLAYNGRVIYFEYAPSFLESSLEISPFKLPLKAGLFACEDRVFEGLFGVFNDSLPDGWGRLLLDRKLMQAGINPRTLTPLDRLQYVGTVGMGALCYEPELSNSTSGPNLLDLDAIASECRQVLEFDENRFVDELLQMNGSSGGARPKVLLRLKQDDDRKEKETDWMVKFPSSFDPKDIGPIEYAYHLMAVDAGLDVPKARLFKAKKGGGYFGVKRFDRVDDQFIHMHTASGLLHADYRIPSLDYETLLKSTRLLTKDAREVEKQFRNAAFNVFAHNRDDHAKNFSFLMDERGAWRVSPAYDLTFSSGPAGEHSTVVMGEGKNPTTQHLLKLAEVASIKKQDALTILEQVKDAVSRWPNHAKTAGVSVLSRENIYKTLIALLKPSPRI